MKKFNEETVENTVKQVYVKPAMEVYEMEVEGAILQASGDDRDYKPWSKADVSPFESPINTKINA